MSGVTARMKYWSTYRAANLEKTRYSEDSLTGHWSVGGEASGEFIET